MPPEGALNTAIRNSITEDQMAVSSMDPARAPWSTLETLVAGVIDELRQLAWMYAAAHSKTAPQKPEFIKRPGVNKRRGRKLMRMSDVRALDPRLKNFTDDEIREMMNSPAVSGEAS
jgi:hypothetical protein